MKNSNLNIKINHAISSLFKQYKELPQIIDQIKKNNGQAFLVGGSVRDIFMGEQTTDIDIEVHDLELEELQQILESFGPVSYVGKSFGILKLHGKNIDWALPRTDMAGRKPIVSINPQLPITEALRRRDLTINAMAINLHTQELVDPFNGFGDIQNKTLRSPDIDFFTQDPLRFYRVMHFISRFDFYPDLELNQVCETMNIKDISIERVEAEFEKLMLKSKRPSLGLRWLDKINRLREILPELENTKGIKQEPEWHPEGDVFEHSMQTVDASALLEYKDQEEKLIIMFASLCHDLGKVSTTEYRKGRLTSYGHAEAGVPLAKSMLKRITKKVNLIESVCVLVKYHMQPGQFVKSNSSLAAYRRLAVKVKNHANLEMLSKLAMCDTRGRNGFSHEPTKDTAEFIQVFIESAKKAHVFYKAEVPVLYGRDISDLVSPGPQMGQLLKYAYKIQIEHGIQDKETLIDYVKQAILK